MQSEFGPRSGTEYYEAKCMHAINQSIGRVIRHRNDYAAIVLIDLRYKSERIVKVSNLLFYLFTDKYISIRRSSNNFIFALIEYSIPKVLDSKHDTSSSLCRISRHGFNLGCMMQRI